MLEVVSSLVVWLLVLPFRLLGVLLLIPLFVLKVILGAVVGLALLPVLLIVGLVGVIGVIGVVGALLVPLLPLLLLGALVWVVWAMVVPALP